MSARGIGSSILGAGNTTVGIKVFVQIDQALQAFDRFAAQVNRALAPAQRSFQNIGLEARQLDRIMQYMIAGSVAAAITSFTRLAAELQRTQLMMIALEGSISKANTQMDRMVGLADKVPFSLGAISDAFIKLKTSGIEPIIDAQGNGPLRNLLDAVAAFGGTEDQLHRAAIAIQQMSGKGVISMEELRQQMGEAVPTAIRVMAWQLKMTMPELIDTITKGQLEAERGINAMLRGFDELYGGLGEKIKKVSLSGAFQGLKNEVDQFALALERMGALDAVTATLHMLRDALKGVNEELRGSDNFASATKEMTEALESFAEWVNNNAEYLAAFSNVILNFVEVMWTLGEVVLNFLGILPPEAAAGGVIGYVLFGPKGALIGALFGMVSEQFAAFVDFVGTVINAVPKDLLESGVIGFLIWGKAGIIGRIVGVVMAAKKVLEGLFNYLMGILRMVMMSANVGAAVIANPLKAWSNVGALYGDAWAKAGKQVEGFRASVGNLGADLGKMVGLGGEGGGASVSGNDFKEAAQRFQTQLKEIREARQALEDAQKKLPPNEGLNMGQLKQYSDAMENLANLEERLTGHRLGPGAKLRQEQEAHLRNLQKMSADLRAGAAEDMINGNSVAAAQKLKAAQDVEAGYKRLKATVEDLAKAEDARAAGPSSRRAQRAAEQRARQLDREADQIARFRSDLEKFEAQITEAEGKVFGTSETQQARNQAIGDYASLKDRFNDMAVSIDNLKLRESERADVMRQLILLQERLNGLTDEAIRLAELKAQWEMDDARTNASRNIRDIDRDLEDLNASSGRHGFDPFADFHEQQRNLQRDWEDRVESLQDQILEWRREMEANPNSELNGARENWISELEARISAYDDYYSYMLSQERQLTDATQQMWGKVGEAIKSSLADGLYNLITGTGDAQDAILSMYQAITKAAIEYLMQLIMIKMMQMAMNMVSGGMGGMGDPGILASMQGLYAKGGVFSHGVQKFAAGGAFTNKVVSGPTLFPMGLMGEAGEEAIMPLARDSRGRLGVHGGGGGDNYNITIQAVDARSVRDLITQNADAIVPALAAAGRLNNSVGRIK